MLYVVKEQQARLDPWQAHAADTLVDFHEKNTLLYTPLSLL
jgi:hypothetical protein